MITPSVLAACREVAGLAMTDTVWICGASTRQTQPDGSVATIPGPTRYGTELEPLPALVQAAGREPSAMVAGGQLDNLSPYVVKVPITVTGLNVGDEVHVSTCGDPTLPGKVIIVREPDAGNGVGIQRRIVGFVNLG